MELPPDASKRARRREKREQELGPERKILSRTEELAVLECGHHIHNPPFQKTVRMIGPSHYRCAECRFV